MNLRNYRMFQKMESKSRPRGKSSPKSNKTNQDKKNPPINKKWTHMQMAMALFHKISIEVKKKLDVTILPRGKKNQWSD